MWENPRKNRKITQGRKVESRAGSVGMSYFSPILSVFPKNQDSHFFLFLSYFEPLAI